MAKVEVRVVPWHSGHRLELYHGGNHIGEYERSMVADEDDLAAKVREAEGTSDLLLDACKHSANGKITVRWNDKTKPRQKEIRTYAEDQPNNPGLGQPVIATIPRTRWRKR